MNSAEYWRLREEKQRLKNIKDEKEYDKKIKEIYQRMMDEVQSEINNFYAKYAKDTGVTMAEAKKKASNLDMEAYSRKAKKYVEEKNFSKQANAEMKLYNLTMKVNRLELLKANIGLVLVSGHDELEKYMDELIENRTLDEIQRQAGILGPTILDNADTVHSIVNASFHNATFSDRIWMHQDLLKYDLESLLATGLIQGKNPNELARLLRKRFNVKTSDAQRLMRTELARVQIAAQQKSYEANGFDEYEYITCGIGDACDTCRALDGKIFSINRMNVGDNAPPMHPNCHCSTGPHMDRKIYNEWLDGLASGKHSLRFDEYKRLNEESKSVQYYKNLKRDKNKVEIKRLTTLQLNRLLEYKENNIYVSKDSKIKRQQVHRINKMYTDCLNAIGFDISNKPDIYIVGESEMGSRAVAAYNFMQNIIYVTPQLGSSKKIVSELTRQFAVNDVPSSTLFHELIHWENAMKYRKKFGKIKDPSNYLEYLNNLAKEELDKIGVNSYNVGEISKYAKDSYRNRNYDEVYTEYLVKKRLKK